MIRYSEESKRLAHLAAAKLGESLEGTDRKLIQEPSGRYVIVPREPSETVQPDRPGRWRALAATFRRRKG